MSKNTADGSLGRVGDSNMEWQDCMATYRQDVGHTSGILRWEYKQ